AGGNSLKYTQDVLLRDLAPVRLPHVLLVDVGILQPPKDVPGELLCNELWHDGSNGAIAEPKKWPITERQMTNWASYFRISDDVAPDAGSPRQETLQGGFGNRSFGKERLRVEHD